MNNADLDIKVSALREKLLDRFEPRRRRTMAVVTSVQLDSAGRIIGAVATVDGLPNQAILTGVGSPVSAGDVWEVANMGGRTMPTWTTVRRLAASLAVPQLIISLILPTPTGLDLTDGVYTIPTSPMAKSWVYASIHTLPDNYGPCYYDFQICTNSLENPTEQSVFDEQVTTTVATDISSSDTVIPRAVGSSDYDFARFGRIQCGAELIDYEAVSWDTGTSGTGTAGDDGTPYVEDSGASWDTDEWKDYALYQNSGAIIARIVSNTATKLYLDRAGASAAYIVYPAFVGCTRGAGSTTPAAHDADDGIVRRSVGLSFMSLDVGPDYNVRCRARRTDGAQSDWCAWGSVTPDDDNIPPPDPTGLTVKSLVEGLEISWNTPNQNTIGDLAGFELWKSAVVGGTSPTKYTTVYTTANQNVRVYGDAGTWGFWNIKVFDIYGNISGYQSGDWILGGMGFNSGGQLATNTDFEVAGTGTWPLYYQFYGISPDPYPDVDYETSGGVYDGACLEVELGTSIPWDYSNVIAWPVLSYLIHVPAVENAIYRTSAYIKPTGSLTMQDIIDNDYFSFQVAAITDDGLNFTYAGYRDIVRGYQDVGEGWYRYYEDQVWEGDPVDEPWLAFYMIFFQAEGTHDGGIFRVDRVQLELGPQMTEWTLNPTWVGNLDTGLRVDTSGILATDLLVDNEGTLERLTVKDGITAPTGTTGKANVYVDTADSKLKVRHGTGTPVILEGEDHADTHITGGGDEVDGDKLDIDWTPSNYTPDTTPTEADNADNLTAHLYGIDQALGGTSEPELDSDRTSTGGPVSLTYTGSGWTTILTRTISVPTGYRALVSATLYVNMDSGQTATAYLQITDGTTTIQTNQFVDGDTADNVHLSYIFTNTGSMTYTLRGNRSGSNAVYARSAYLTVIVYKEA